MSSKSSEFTLQISFMALSVVNGSVGKNNGDLYHNITEPWTASSHYKYLLKHKLYSNAMLEKNSHALIDHTRTFLWRVEECWAIVVL